MTGIVTLRDSFASRRNSLGFLRYLFAAFVVLDHTFPISGLHGGKDPLWGWSRGQDSFGGLAVTGFFVISGYLITKSHLSAPSTGRFLWRRFLRIFPGFWVCLVVTALVLAPIAWHHERGNLGGYFRLSVETPWHYITGNGLLWMHQYNIGGLLSGTPYAHSGYPMAWDGSLWTLIYEFKCYLLIAALGCVGLLARHRACAPFLATAFGGLSILYSVDASAASRLLPPLLDQNMVRFGYVFFLGSAMALYAEKVEVSSRWAIASAVLFLVTLRQGGLLIVGTPAFAYLVMYGAVRLPLHSFERYGDFSYGTYIYAFPVQQLLALYGFQRFGLAAFVAASLLGATALAVVSWHVVERPAMKLKDVQAPFVRKRSSRSRLEPLSENWSGPAPHAPVDRGGPVAVGPGSGSPASSD